MTETAKERIYREAKKRINMRKNGIHPSDYFEGWVVDYIDSSTTDKLSVEKLQERCDRYEKALTEIKTDIHRNLTLDYNSIGWLIAMRKRLELKIEKALAAIGGDDEN